MAAPANPAPIATAETESSGTAPSSATTRRSVLSRAPVSRSRLNGRFRSASPAAMPAASVQPAIGRLTRITTFASCW